jgi:hypothetical protein
MVCAGAKVFGREEKNSPGVERRGNQQLVRETKRSE